MGCPKRPICFAMSLPDRRPCVRTISTAADSRFRSEVNVADTSANTGGYASGVSATLSGPAPHKAGVMAALSVVGRLCPVNALVVPGTLSE